MRIAVIGTGYVGLVSGACFSEFGVDTVCVDADATKIDALRAGHIPIYEPGLASLVENNSAAGRLSFTTDIEEALSDTDAVFIAVGTPSRRGNGHADLSYVFEAARQVARNLKHYAVIVTKSTVPVGTGEQVRAIIREERPDLEFDVASNPEFLREGSAIDDFMRPDRVVIGVDSPRAEKILRDLYRPLYLISTPIVATGIETAELTKYAANSFLALKISFINEVSDLCERVGADIHDVARAMGLDGRIGPKFLHPGPGFGGSCFPKDTRAFAETALNYDRPLQLINAVIEINEARKHDMVNRISKACGGDLLGKRIAVLGLSFKPNTDDIRESPSLTIVPELQARGAQVTAFDPAGMAEAGKTLRETTFAADAYEALDGADACVVLTEWNQFRGLDHERMRTLLKQPVIVDLRNIFNPDDMKRAGFQYSCLGRS